MSAVTGTAGGASGRGMATPASSAKISRYRSSYRSRALPPLVSMATARPCAGQQPQERRLPDRVAVVADQPLTVPAEPDPAETPRVPEGVLVGQVGVLGGHGGGAGLAEHPGAVRGQAAGQVHPGEGQQVRRRRR